MSRVSPYNMFSMMVSKLPFVIAGRTFKTLNSMQDSELEDFLSYLVRFEASKFRMDPKKKPKWWVDELDFPEDFHTGRKFIPFTEDKLEKMRTSIRNCYAHHRATELIVLSEKLAMCPSRLDWRRNGNGSMVVYHVQTGKPLAVVMASNLEYDLNIAQISGVLMNTGLDIRFSNGPKKRLRLYQGCPTKLEVMDSFEEYIDFESDSVIKEESPKETPRFKPNQAADILEDQDDEFKLLEPVPLFLSKLNLMRSGASSPNEDFDPVWFKTKTIPCKSFNASDVPMYVRMGLWPKWCLTNDYQIAKRWQEIDCYMDGRNIGTGS